jgi:peptide/nickel transport system substrate-binding protein
MDNRFGLKDFVLFALVIVLIVMVWLSMLQRDRMWPKLQALEESIQNQTRDLSSIRRQLSQGVTVHGGRAGAATTQAAGDPFALVAAAEQMPGFARGDWLIDNFGTKVPKLTPLISQDVYGSIVQNRVQESLAYRDPYSLEYVPLLAQSWQASDDGMKYTFQLRLGVTFSDGVPFTAEDVVFTYNWIMNPKVNAPRARAYYDKIKSVEAASDHEVVFIFKEPYFESFALAADLQVMPKHFYEKFTPEQFNEAPGLLLGTGPYRLKDPQGWRPGDQIELFRNERYWGEPTTFDRLVYYQVENDAASMTQFKNGEVDLFGAQPEQYNLLLKDKELLKRTQHFEYESPIAGYTYIAWNQKRGGKPTRFADARVRKAMTMLTDRQRISDEVMLGYAKPAAGPFARQSKQYDPSIEPWPYSPDKARALLKEAGFEDRNGDGVLESAQGEPFRFKLSYPSASELYTRIVLFLKDTYAKAGIAMEPDPQDWPIIMKKMDQRDFDAISLAWTGGVETDIYQMFHSSQIKDGGDNFMSYDNPKLDEVIEHARSTVKEDQRMPLWREAHRILHEDQPYTFLINRKSLVFADARIKNIEPSKLGLNYVQRQVMPVPWFVPKDQQKWSK